ncbi:hypothetical protein MHZ95_05210 [Sporosarcina sp. ACRSM]|uniref:hypothetical protein n=1 Tax=Sporosarcina sp. ACRSM TaxID=2918216 RepID=UPI001EF56435|nr:hypothetical protein [Sporosarcina sp. ACRSM]MCG7334681.1 hypothetical protein [Sporosarcina sp. ACRSM]
MGVMIFLDIMPDHIDASEWEKVYEETLEIINGYPFLDSIFDDQTYHCNWQYVTRTEERAIPFADNQIGWHTIGDEQSLKIAESFVLVKDLQYYREYCGRGGNCEDILFSSIYDYPGINEQLKQLKVNKVHVFDAKTQGEPFHIPLLAIACLIESRFPQHAMVYGDISIGQMEKALKWANSILKKPIELTERANNGKLLMRIKQELKDEAAALEVFMDLTMREQDRELGELVRMHFSYETIATYYLSQFKKYKIGTFGFATELSNYLDQGFRLEDACELCVLDPAGCNYDAQKFAKSVLSMEWPTNDRSLTDLIPTKINAPNSDEPETVNSMLGKTLLQMSGFREEMKSNLTFEEVVCILRDQLGHLCNIDLLIDKVIEKDRDLTTLLEDFHAKFDKDSEDEEVKRIHYAITAVEDLILWKHGDKIHPNLEDGIVMVKEFVEKLLERDKEFFAAFQNMTAKEKMRKLIQFNQFFYIHKRVWDEIVINLNDSERTNKILGVLLIQADEITINKLCKYSVNNQALFKAYFL